jgi:DNA polymerase III subunit beta
MTCKITLQKNIFTESLAIVGRAVGSRTALPILSNILLSKENGGLQLSATNLTFGASVWMDANMDGDFALTLLAKTLTDVISLLGESEFVFSANGKPEVSIKSGSYKGVVKGIEASEFPVMPEYDMSAALSLDAAMLREMIQSTVIAASADEARPVLTGVLLSIEGNQISMVAADGFRLAIRRAHLPEKVETRQVIIPAASLKEVMRILSAVRANKISMLVPPKGSQVVIRCENVQLVSQLVDGRYPDYQGIIPKSFKTRMVVSNTDLMKACKQAGIIAREGGNVIRLHLVPGEDQTGKVQVLAESNETGTSEVELAAAVTGVEMTIAFNVRFLLEVLDVIQTMNVAIEMNANNTPAVIRPVVERESRPNLEEGYLYVLMPMHID